MKGPIGVRCTGCLAEAGQGCTAPGATLSHRRRKVDWFHWVRIVAGEQADHEAWEAARQEAAR